MLRQRKFNAACAICQLFSLWNVRSDFLLLRDEGVATITRREFRPLNLFDASGHAAGDLILRQVEHVGAPVER